MAGSVSSIIPFLNATSFTEDTTKRTDIHCLPEEIISIILSHIPEDQLERCSNVCHLWRRKVNEIVPQGLSFFGRESWKKYFDHETEEEAPLPPLRANQICRSLQIRLKESGEVMPCFLFLMPKGLTLNLFRTLVENSKEGNKTMFDKCCSSCIFEKLGNKPIDKSYWCLMTLRPLKGSTDPMYEDIQMYIKQKAGPLWRIPTLLQAAVCLTTNYITQGETQQFLNEGTSCDILCKEWVNEMRIRIGHSPGEGLFIREWKYIIESAGVAALRELD